AHARQPFLDLRAEALVARLDGHLPQELRLRRLAGEVVEGAYRARELRSLLDETLSLAAVLPEGGRGHLGVDRGQARLLAGEVKDGPGGRPAACRDPARRASARRACPRRPPEECEAEADGRQRETAVWQPVTQARVERGAGPE